MVIDKLLPYWTHEDKERLNSIRREQESIINALQKDQDEKARLSLLSRWSHLETSASNIALDVQDKYTKTHNEKGVLSDIQEVVNALTREDFLDDIEQKIRRIAKEQADGVAEESLSIRRKRTIENYDNCYLYISETLLPMLNALSDYYQEYNPGKATDIIADKINPIIDRKASSWYPKHQPALPPYLTIAHGKVTDAFSFMSTRSTSGDVKLDPITGNATIKKMDVTLVISELSNLRTTLGVSTDKLLSTALAEFTRQNDFRVGTEPKREISIPLNDYIRMLGYDIDMHETKTPKEATLEKKRVKTIKDNVRKSVKKDLGLIQHSSLTWEEPIKGKSKDFISVNLVSQTRIYNGQIGISFTPEIASYLAERNLFTQYATALLKLDERQPNAYRIGRKLITHYNIDNNQKTGTKDRISIKSLLAITDLPSFKDVQLKDRGHWIERIKEPFEKALDTLTQIDLLKNWEYTHARGIPLTDEEANSITKYEYFSDLYLHFTPVEEINHQPRLEAKQVVKENTRRNNKAKEKD